MTIKTFVLIYYIFSTPIAGGGMATGTAEYGSFGECERAGKHVKDDFGSATVKVVYICTSKTIVPVSHKH